MEDLRPTVALAEQATRIAGDYLLAHQDQTRIIMQKAPDDPLLDADLEAQRLILQTLQSGFPELGVSVGRGRGSASRRPRLLDH